MNVTSEDPELVRVDAADLAPGLYVAELDRPWAEVPVMFQGFQIADDEELDILRQHCAHVFVDPGRSRAEAIESLTPAESAGAQPSGGPGPRRERSDVADAFTDARQPDTDAFRGLVAEAQAERSEVLGFLDEAVRNLEAGGGVDTDGARDAVAELAALMSRNTTASLWLTNLRDRDEYTTRHAVNVCVLMLAFGTHFGFDRGELERFAMGALLIDIGMTRMPTELVHKRGPLTTEEWEVMRAHPQAGAEVVKEAGYVPGETLDIIQLHHERLDGSGYPFGLHAGQIPIHARLAGLFDTYDAMISPRVFQDATPPDRVLQYLLNEADGTFGITPVQQLIRCVGLYPVGSLVELDNGAAAVVLGSRPDARVRPTVLLVRTPDGDFFDKRIVLNLAADPERGGPSPRSVRRVLDPVAEDIDVPGIFAIEFGLA